MEWLKMVLERFFGFIAAVIPGVAVLMLFGIHHPEWAIAFRDIGYLGYSTKVSLVFGAALIAGWTISTLFMALSNGVEGALSPWLEKWVLNAKEPDNPPWRNKTWRALLSSYLGAAAPEDLDLISDEVVQIRIGAAKYQQDPQRQFEEIQKWKMAKTQAEIMDSHWRSWWDTLHQEVILEKRVPVTQMALTIETNLQAASAVLLFAIPSTPTLNHWWVISSCTFWLVMRVLRGYALLYKARNPWSSFIKQMEYLRSHLPSEKAKAQGSDS